MNNPLSADPKKTKGRLYKEYDEEFQTRSPYERDRDRIIHSNSFRKLKFKTQVFIQTDSDYYRTRLTHSLEVSQITRSLCRLMNLNEDLGEVVALSHDLGHSPFGHNGEKSLNIFMEGHGGFNHNDQSLRIMTKIEKRHPNFDGLNLSWESLEGIAKHNGKILNNISFHTTSYNKLHNLHLNLNPYLESQVAAISDDVAYNNHDLEDSIRAGLINLESLKEINYFNEIIKKLKYQYKEIENNILIYQILRKSISNMINDINQNSKKVIEQNKINNIEDIKNFKFFLISMSNEMKTNCSEISSFLYANVYNHPNLLKIKKHSENIIFKLFEYYEKNFDNLPCDWLIMQKNESKKRIICDYISGMTDRYANKLYESIYE